MIVMIMVGCLGTYYSSTVENTEVRLIYMSTDPYTIHGFMPPAADSVLFDISTILWLNTFFMLLLYWYFSFLM